MLSIRKIGVVGRTYRHLNRYRQILAVLFRYGFGDLVELLRIDQYMEIGLQLISKKRRDRIDKLTRAERVSLALEELGPTFIKLGQILSTRPDLIPIEFVTALSRLQDRVPPFAFQAACRILEKELGGPLSDTYADLEDTPLAAASIGQVYRARLVGGDTVAVKVQRPDIRQAVEVDLEIMLHLATLMERHIEELAFHRPVRIVEEFARTLEREIDYTIEATNMERVHGQFLDDPSIYIPKVYRGATTSRVLTMEFVEGIKVSDLVQIAAAGLDRNLICSRGADFCLKQIFVHGFFHADPHPGNISVLADNVICLFDFGMTGTIDRTTREEFVDLIDAVVHRNEAGAVQVLLKLTEWEDIPDRRLLERDVADFIGRHLYRPLKEIQLGKLLNHLLELASRHRLRISPDIFLMMKALGTVEGVARRLDPEFDLISKAAPFIENVKLARFNPQRVAGDMVRLASELLSLVHQLPRDLTEIRRLARQQRLKLRLEHIGLDSLLSTHDQISNRISFSIIIAALLIGSALIVISKTPPLFYGISLIGIIGFGAAAVMGIWLLIAILRTGRL
jgi:ubiquinone biosynthesis protein